MHMCNICKINNINVINKIEDFLNNSNGRLTLDDKKSLKGEFPELSSSIDSITDKDCSLHWNFHQSVRREVQTIAEEGKSNSLNKDINKDEAQVLTDLLNTQAATFNALTNKINSVLIDDESDMKNMIINPINIQLYRETADSIRSTVKELRELNREINGSKDSSLEGLKAIAAALGGNTDKKEAEMTTDMYD